jgi:hypothetical protein
VARTKKDPTINGEKVKRNIVTPMRPVERRPNRKQSFKLMLLKNQKNVVVKKVISKNQNQPEEKHNLEALTVNLKDPVPKQVPKDPVPKQVPENRVPEDQVLKHPAPKDPIRKILKIILILQLITYS